MRLMIRIVVVAFILLMIFVPNQPESGTGFVYLSPSAQVATDQVEFWGMAYMFIKASHDAFLFFAILTLELLNGAWEVTPPSLRMVFGLFFVGFNILAFIGLYAILGADRIFRRLF